MRFHSVYDDSTLSLRSTQMLAEIDGFIHILFFVHLCKKGVDELANGFRSNEKIAPPQQFGLQNFRSKGKQCSVANNKISDYYQCTHVHTGTEL